MTVRPLQYPNPPLADDLVQLRPWSEKDLPAIEEASRDPQVPMGTTVPEVFTPAEGRAFVHRQHSRLLKGEGVSLAVADAQTGVASGLVILRRRPQPGVGGVGYWIIPSARGRGMASRAVDLITTWGLASLDLHRVEAWVTRDNLASQGVLESAGFEREGLLRKFLVLSGEPRDVYVYARLTPVVPG